MNHMDIMQQQIEVTRQQIISQLNDEISHFQNELRKLSYSEGETRNIWGQRIYARIIDRKRELIASLS